MSRPQSDGRSDTDLLEAEDLVLRLGGEVSNLPRDIRDLLIWRRLLDGVESGLQRLGGEPPKDPPLTGLLRETLPLLLSMAETPKPLLAPAVLDQALAKLLLLDPQPPAVVLQRAWTLPDREHTILAGDVGLCGLFRFEWTLAAAALRIQQVGQTPPVRPETLGVRLSRDSQLSREAQMLGCWNPEPVGPPTHRLTFHSRHRLEYLSGREARLGSWELAEGFLFIQLSGRWHEYLGSLGYAHPASETDELSLDLPPYEASPTGQERIEDKMDRMDLHADPWPAGVHPPGGTYLLAE